MATEKNIQTLIEACDADIRAGKPDAAVARLANLKVASLEREVRLPLATLCRRTALIDLGLRILAPVMAAERGAHQTAATAEELTVYASLLSRVGSIKEALSILEGIDKTTTPGALLIQGFCHISKWDYGAAIGPLKLFLQSGPAAYFAAVARVNLYSALVFGGDLEEAESELTGELNRGELSPRLRANCFELRAQIHLRAERFPECYADLDNAGQLIKSEQSVDAFFVKKWRAIATALARRDCAALETFRSEARSRGDWESVRDADFHLLKIRFDNYRFQHLLFGTPFQSYRARIQRELPSVPAGHFLWGASAEKPEPPYLDLVSGEISGGPTLKAGSKIHQVIEILSRDFYRPMRIGALFSELYPEEKFSIFSSPARVHQVLDRLRNWAKDNELPLTLSQIEGEYRIFPEPGFAIRIPLHRPTVDNYSAFFEQLRRYHEPMILFTAQDACKQLSCSRTSFRRWAERAVASGHIERFGAGPSTQYMILPAPVTASKVS